MASLGVLHIVFIAMVSANHRWAVGAQGTEIPQMNEADFDNSDKSSNCGAELLGWESQENRIPVGKWMPVFAANKAVCAAECAVRKTTCVAAMWHDMEIPMPAALKSSSQCEIVTELRDMQKVDMPAGLKYLSPCATGCGAKVEGYQHHSGRYPRGEMKAQYALTVADCISECSMRGSECVAAVWEDAILLPFGEAYNCRLVNKLNGYDMGMPMGVDLYIKC